ncbi:hypothetical protein EDB80DRAFT_838076 [Ilyonectria destructans]|nr:hypothetical protein EDB80DRAFT_838076 [Ilyonectria destructans]
MDYDEMLKHPGLEAVVVATVTAVHPENAIKAMEADKHVLCEKSLSTSVEISQSPVDVANRKPHLKVMCGFSRRFDASYRDAMARTEAGDIGRPSIFRSQTCDKLDPSAFFVSYAEFSGGIFVDCNIHDIDLALWCFGQDSVVKSVVGHGIRDVDNGIGIVEFWGEKVAYLFSSRMMAAGQHDVTEIVGTKGKLAVNANPHSNLVEIHEPTGVRRELPPNYYSRFEYAFVAEANEFTTTCLDNNELPFSCLGRYKLLRLLVHYRRA